MMTITQGNALQVIWNAASSAFEVWTIPSPSGKIRYVKRVSGEAHIAFLEAKLREMRLARIAQLRGN